VDGLYDLISNVLLFEIEGSGGQQFHSGSPWKILLPSALAWNTQQQLKPFTLIISFPADTFWQKEAHGISYPLEAGYQYAGLRRGPGHGAPLRTQVMKELGILSLEIQPDAQESGPGVFHPAEAPYFL